MFNNNLTGWLAGGTQSRELADTRRRWDEVEALWRACPLSRQPLSDFAVEAVLEAALKASRMPATPLLVALAVAVENILAEEDVVALEPQWDLVERDVEVAVRFRQMLARRRRWAADFAGMWAIVRRRFVVAMVELFERLPDGAFVDWSEAEPSFGVPLADLVEDLPGLLDQWVLFPYDDDTLRLDLFQTLRHSVERNLLVASGFSPADDARERMSRLVFPSKHRDKAATGLADLYLIGTALGPALDITVPFHIPAAARFEHGHILGGTGHGKTQFMQRMILDDLEKAAGENRSVIVIDSQGDLIQKISRLEMFAPGAPGNLAERLVIIDPADVEHPPALNLFDAHLARLDHYTAVDRERVLNGVVELYEVFFGALLGAELTQKQGVIFRYLARLMLAIPGATIHTLMQLMEDGRPFKPHMEALDGSARFFFATEFFHPSFAATKKQILRRLWGVLSTPAFERMFAQARNRLDLFEAMRSGKIVLINTAKDLLKTDGSQLFGRFFMALIAQAALERSTLDEDDRNPVFVYVDEAQEYFDDRVETILTQARKYKVGITLAHQTLDQLTPRLRAAFAANTSLKCVGGVSARDARAMAEELRTDTDFIESMRRRPGRTEFAVWLKHATPQAIRLSAPLGVLERRPQMTEEAFELLLDLNRSRYCGTLAEAQRPDPPAMPSEPEARSARAETARPSPRINALPIEPAEPLAPIEASETPEGAPVDVEPMVSAPNQAEPAAAPRPLAPLPPPRSAPPATGKGGPRHRYLQALIKELAEQQGLRAQLEAPLPGGGGQADVMLVRDGLTVALEISVTTPVEQELQNLRKCLEAGCAHVAVVLAKSTRVRERFRTVITASLSQEEQARVSLLAPEELPDFISALAAPPPPTETVVKGYKVRVNYVEASPQETRLRRDQLARILAKSLQPKD